MVWEEDYFINVDNANIRDEEGRTWLHKSCLLGDFDNVKALVEAGYDVNAVDRNGGTPLHSAAMYKNCEIMVYLIRNGSDRNITDNFKYKAFEYLDNSEIQAINLLLGENYSPTNRLDISDYSSYDSQYSYFSVYESSNEYFVSSSLSGESDNDSD